MEVLNDEEIEILENYIRTTKLTKKDKDLLVEQILISTNLLKNSNDLFFPLFNDKSRFLVLLGGGGSGKSVFAAHKIIHRARIETGNKWVVFRKVGSNLRDSVFKELTSAINVLGYESEFSIPQGRSSDLYLKHIKTGNEILFFGVDDAEKIKSISGINNMWIEEASEFDVEDFRQLNIRMRHQSPTYNQMIISFNPVNINHWLKEMFFDRSKIRV